MLGSERNEEMRRELDAYLEEEDYEFIKEMIDPPKEFVSFAIDKIRPKIIPKLDLKIDLKFRPKITPKLDQKLDLKLDLKLDPKLDPKLDLN